MKHAKGQNQRRCKPLAPLQHRCMRFAAPRRAGVASRSRPGPPLGLLGEACKRLAEMCRREVVWRQIALWLFDRRHQGFPPVMFLTAQREARLQRSLARRQTVSRYGLYMVTLAMSAKNCWPRTVELWWSRLAATNCRQNEHVGTGR